MLVDINLLPKKDEKNIAIYVIAGSIVLVLLIVSAFFVVHLNAKKQELQNLNQQVSMNQKILDEQHQKLVQYESSQSVIELKNAIKWAKGQPFNMVYVLQQLTKVLPERGFILEFEMNEENVITQKLQFDTKSDAAYYLNSIVDLPWVDEAVISEAKTTDILKNSSNEQVKTAIEVLDKANILPRYYAAYEIKLNIPQLKKASEKEEGGISP